MLKGIPGKKRNNGLIAKGQEEQAPKEETYLNPSDDEIGYL